MKKELIITVFFLINFCNILYGQKPNSNEELDALKNDTTKVNLLNKLASDFKSNDSIARSYALRAKNISDSIGFKKGVSESLSKLGLIEKTASNYYEAIGYYKQSLIIDLENNNIYGQVRANIQIGRVYQKLEEYQTALSFSLEAKEKCKKINKKELLASICGTIASIYKSLNSFDLALESYHESIRVREELGNSSDLAKSYLNIGVLYNSLRNDEQALFYLRKSELIYTELKKSSSIAKVYNSLGYNYAIRKDLDSALVYYQKSLNIKKGINASNQEILLNNIGGIYEEKNEFNIALGYYLESIELAESSSNNQQLVTSFYNIGKLYRKMGNFSEALNYLNRSLDLTKKYRDDIVRLELLITLAEAYESLKDYKNASLYNEKHIVLRDSIDEKYRDAEKIETKYQNEIEKNKLLRKEEEVNQEKILRLASESRRKNLVLYTLIGGLILLALLFFVSFKAYKARKAKEIAEKNQKIEIQKNIELLKKQELRSIKAMINGQESERKRIAQDLHDRLGSMLSVIKLRYKNVEESLDKLKDENKEQYEQVNTLLDEACEAVREIAHNMVSGVLTKFGLLAALEDLKNTIEGTNTFKIELLSHGLDDRLENTLEMELYGIIQELIHNIIKHAKASEVSIQLVKRANEINLTVIDDGIGFDYIESLEYNGMGLKSVISRVSSLNGVFSIDSGKGNGTTISIDLPL
ncbi:sensor histidine kinase [Winogradskyella sp.]|jgi:signal transduction histidine kinase|uniref:tetratricopeptide repeat-containing sensor histidine kinase n=1 Tax=Winogradskyella sp. TaxID=1883156 RepID=UPI0025D0A39D|nr:sensor histidine kinase [Winogradskyella sp.]MCT4628814.1 sensor histidine kinase [Winogradskyella sp.]